MLTGFSVQRQSVLLAKYSYTQLVCKSWISETHSQVTQTLTYASGLPAWQQSSEGLDALLKGTSAVIVDRTSNPSVPNLKPLPVGHGRTSFVF